jgi:prephenate dehydrogenase
MKNIKVGIIGGTNGMGQWFAGLLQKENCTVHICGRKTVLGINDIVRICNVVVVAVPISATAAIIKQVGPLLPKDTLLMDLTSLKREPVELMLANSPAEVIGCHPLFGPALTDVSGQNIVLYPARGTKWFLWIKNICKKNKMVILETAPDEHDKMMAIVQVLNHLNTILLGMAIAETDIPLAQISKFSTPIFKTKLEIIKKVFTESPGLYADIITENPQTGKMLDIYERVLADIRRPIEYGGGTKLKETIEEAAKKLYGSKNQ